MSQLRNALMFVALVVLSACNLSDPETGVTVGNNENNENNATTGNNATTPVCDLACENGACELTAGVAECVCDEGYGGGLCDACASGFQDNDSDGVCTESCVGLDCGEFGTCDDTSGTRICVCDDEHQGELCDECADGLQDNDGDGVCAPSCDAAPADQCGTFGFCDDSSGQIGCACPAGQAFSDADGDCVITVPLDPEFDDDPAASPWMTTGNVVLDNTLVGLRDPGLAVFGEPACLDGGYVSQTYDLAERDVTGPLFVDVAFKTGCMFQPCFEASGLGVRMGTAFQTIPTADSFQEDHEALVCLGEAAYGMGATFAISNPNPPGGNCDFGYLEAVDHLEFVRATEDECPTPGALLNGRFDQAMVGNEIPGWTIGTRGSYQIEIVNGENALVMKPGQRCVSQFASTTVGIPAGPTAWAITYTSVLSDSARSSFRVGPISESEIGDGAVRSGGFCLPRWMNGTYVDVRYAVSGQSGACNDTSPWTNILDNVELVATPECGETGILRDGTFDTTGPSPWIYPSVNSATYTFPTVNGNRYLRMSAGQCDSPAATQSILIPPGANSPNALQFRYNYADDDRTNATAIVSTSRLTLNETNGAWRNGEICIPPSTQGFPIDVRIGMGSTGLCAPGNPLPAALELDDIELVTSSNCP